MGVREKLESWAGDNDSYQRERVTPVKVKGVKRSAVRDVPQAHASNRQVED